MIFREPKHTRPLLVAKFEGYRTTIYAEVKGIATTGIGNRV